MLENLKYYTFDGEVNMTLLAQGCADHFELLTEMGETDIEEKIFELVTEFFSD